MRVPRGFHTQARREILNSAPTPTLGAMVFLDCVLCIAIRLFAVGHCAALQPLRPM